jgi:hypothetical protein
MLEWLSIKDHSGFFCLLLSYVSVGYDKLLFHEHCVLCSDAVSSSDDIVLNSRKLNEE